jgi:hypothetical protein
MENTTTKMSHLSLTKKILFISFLIITIVFVYCFNIYTQKPTTQPRVSTSKQNCNQCSLSMKESDDWFCESDSDWKRRKRVHHKQDRRNRISDSRPVFFQNNWEPTLHCEFEQRIGRTGDGGKWVCDIHRFKQNNTNILVYSFGSNGEFSFERAIKEELSTAEIHTFDMGLYKCPKNICTFHRGQLGDGKSDNSKSLQMILNELGHEERQIDLLKVDIEGSEFMLFEELFDSSTKKPTDIPYIRQILFEIHLPGSDEEEPSRRTHKLFELFRSNNYAIFHKEVNLYVPANVCEYALLKLNPAFFIFPF